MKKMTKAMLMTALICGTMYCGAEPVHANELDTFTLDEYVVTATRTPVKVFDANANISVVTREEIENAHYDNLESALRNTPGVQIINYGNKGMNSNGIRINGANNVVLLVDGVRVNHSGMSGIQADYLNLDNVQSIEVLKGAASALYGSDAKGGVINVITRKPAGNKTTITMAGGSFGAEQYKLHNEGKEKSWSYSIDVAKELQGDYKDGNGKEWDNKYNSENVNLKIRKELGEGSDLTVGYDYHKYDWKYENTPNGKNWYGSGGVGDTENKAFYATWNQKIDDTTNNTLAVRNSEYKYNCQYPQHYKTLSITDYLTKQFEDNHIVTLGVDYVKDNDVYNGKNAYTKIFNRAIYLQDEWNFDEKWKLTSGVRYDDNSWAGNSTTPRFNLGYKFNDDTNIYVSYSEFFIAPDIAKYTTGMGNPNLKPEEGENYEIGINHKFDDTFSMTAHTFKRKTDNKFKGVGDYYGGTYQIVNMAEEDAKGFDIQFSKLLNNNLSLFTGYTYVHMEADGNNINDGGYFPEHTINLGLDYNNKKLNVLMNARAILERGIGQPKGKFPDNNYVLVDLAANYKPVENIKLFARVNNLFDKYYAEQTDWYSGAPVSNDNYYAMPGRTILVGMEYSF